MNPYKQKICERIISDIEPKILKVLLELHEIAYKEGFLDARSKRRPKYYIKRMEKSE
jgi:hypothetical protein